MRRQHLHQILIRLGKFIRANLVGQIQIAQRFAPGNNRHTQKGNHGGMSFRKTNRAGIVGNAWHPDGASLLDNSPQQTQPLRQVRNTRSNFRIHTAIHKRFQIALAIGHTQGGIFSISQFTSGLNNLLQHFVQRQFAGDSYGCLV